MKIILTLSLMFLIGASPQRPGANYDESKVGTYTLPDPLVFNNGHPVRTAKDWKNRRAEIIRLLQDNVYGHSPQATHLPAGIKRELEVDRHALGGKAIREQLAIRLLSSGDGPKAELLIYLPAGATKPVPLILALNFDGNHTVINDPGIRLPMIWDPRTHEHRPARDSERGSATDYEVEKILAHGYGFATIYYQDIEPDFKGGATHGLRAQFPKADWGAIGAWAYGLSRAMDYLETDLNVDAKRVAVMGHSRLGKTALWAAALDPRFALVIANCSGEGGASLSRRNYGETIRNLVDVFPYWFTPNYQKYADHADQLPVDAHELIALAAPRPVYITGAEDDQWADPRGEFLACVAAGPVFRLLGAQDLGTDQMPPLNQPIQHTIAFHYRTGKHEVTAFDWDQFLRFADEHMK